MSEMGAEGGLPPAMSNTSPDGGCAALRGSQANCGPAGEPTPAGGAILSAEWIAEVLERHHEFEAKYCDDDGNIVLRERRCAHCDEDWPCEVAALTARLAAVEGERDAALATIRMLVDWGALSDSDDMPSRPDVALGELTGAAFEACYGFSDLATLRARVLAALGQEPPDGR